AYLKYSRKLNSICLLHEACDLSFIIPCFQIQIHGPFRDQLHKCCRGSEGNTNCYNTIQWLTNVNFKLNYPNSPCRNCRGSRTKRSKLVKRTCKRVTRYYFPFHFALDQEKVNIWAPVDITFPKSSFLTLTPAIIFDRISRYCEERNE